MRGAVGLDLGNTLFFLVCAHSDELDDLFGYTQAALDFGDQGGRRFNDQKHIDAVVELVDGVGEATAAHLFHVLDGALAGGDVAGEGLDALIDVGVLEIGAQDVHHFVAAIHGASFRGVLPRTAPDCSFAAPEPVWLVCCSLFVASP